MQVASADSWCLCVQEPDPGGQYPNVINVPDELTNLEADQTTAVPYPIKSLATGSAAIKAGVPPALAGAPDRHRPSV